MNLNEFNYNTFMNYINYRQYKKIVKKFNQYVSLEKVGITPFILDKYIEALINTNEIEEAYKSLKILVRFFPKYYDERKLGEIYIKCNALNDLEELCKNLKNKNNYYNFAKACLYWNHLNESKILFYKYILYSNDNVKIKYSIKYIDRINKSENENIFLPVSYVYFRNNGNDIKPGHIIYVYKSFNYNEKTPDYIPVYKDPKPYLVWKIEGNKVYGFPITKNIYNMLTYIIKKEKYSSFLYDERIKDELTIINKKDIEKVTELISEDDFNKSLKSVHQLICITQDEKNKYFNDERVKDFNISKGNIIQLYDKENMKFKSFYIIEDNDNYFYKCLLIDGGNYKILSDEYVYIKKDDYIKECYKLKEDKIDNIESQIKKISKKL